MMEPKLNHKIVEGFDVIEHGECSFNQAQELVKKANAEAVGGHSDWVLPDLVTTRALHVLEGRNAIHLWVSSSLKGSCYRYGAVYWGRGSAHEMLKLGTGNHVRLARVSQFLDIVRVAEQPIFDNGEMDRTGSAYPQRLFLAMEAQRKSMAEAGIELDAEEERPLVDRPRGG